jgi:hypothetical protein
MFEDLATRAFLSLELSSKLSLKEELALKKTTYIELREDKSPK